VSASHLPPCGAPKCRATGYGQLTQYGLLDDPEHEQQGRPGLQYENRPRLNRPKGQRPINVCLHMFTKYSAIRTVLSYTVIPALNLMGLGLEEIARSSNEAFAVNYSVMAWK
jgi:hypothetical protein